MRSMTLLFVALAAFGQAPPPANQGGGGPVALVRFQVSPQKGQPVTDLRAEEIEIREDGKPRPVVALESGASKQHEIPIEISLLFDCDRTALASGEMDPKLFQDALLNEFPNVSVAIYGFSPGLSRLAAPTRAQADLAKAMEAPLRVHPLSTFLMDHVSRVLIDAASGPTAALRMVVVVSTGRTDQGSMSDSDQDQKFQRAVSIAQQANVSAFPVVMVDRLATQDATGTTSVRGGSSVRGPQTSSSDISSTTLARLQGNFGNLGPSTGGKKFELPVGGNLLPSVLKWLADEIRDGYVAGFEASMAAEKKKHKIQVVMKNKDRGRIASGALNLVY